MRSRLAQFDRMYRRRMGWSLPGGVLLTLGALLVCSRHGILPAPLLASQPGPLRVLPQIDLPPVEETQDTAAPRPPIPSDFVVLDLELHEAPEEPMAELTPDPAASGLLDNFQPAEDADQTDLRTSGLPVLAQTEFEIVHFERPVYPRVAREAGIEGLVEVLLRVEPSGLVAQAEVMNRGRLPLLEASAVAALRQAVFRPYCPNGTPAPFWVRIPVRFSLLD